MRAMNRWVRVLGVVGVGLTVGGWAAEDARAERHRLGGGVHYWRTVEDLDNSDFDIDEDGFAYLVSYQYLLAQYLKLEVDLEIFPDTFGGYDETVYSPLGLVIVGSGLYAGLGAGTLITSEEFGEDPFWLVRAGIDIEVLPSLRLDINANYYFTEFDAISELDEDLDSNTITLGAMLRLAF